jgi:hypothetical protein
MMFGIGGFGRRGGVGRGGFMGGGMRAALLSGAGMMAWRWWRNRQAGRNNPGPMERDPRQSYDTGQTTQSGGSF